jgi:Immunoglobulin domain
MFLFLFQEVGQGSTLVLLLNNQTAGRYTCRATAAGFPPVTAAAAVQVRGPPRLLLAGRELQTGSSGQPLHVVCEAESVPEAESVSWSYRGRELRPGSPLFSILETRLGSLVRSTLVIQQAEEKHFGEYTCTVNNSLGSSSDTITVKEIGMQLFFFCFNLLLHFKNRREVKTTLCIYALYSCTCPIATYISLDANGETLVVLSVQ